MELKKKKNPLGDISIVIQGVLTQGYNFTFQLLQNICKTHGEQLWHALDGCTVNLRKYRPIGSCFSGKQIFSGADLWSRPWGNLEKTIAIQTNDVKLH